MHPWHCPLPWWAVQSPHCAAAQGTLTCEAPGLQQAPHQLSQGLPRQEVAHQAQPLTEPAARQHVIGSWNFTEEICKADCPLHTHSQLWYRNITLTSQKKKKNKSRKMNANALMNYLTVKMISGCTFYHLLSIRVKGLRLTHYIIVRL